MHEFETALAQVRNAWLAGRSALDQAPAPWREAIGSDELALVALAGHATDVLTRQTPAAPLVDRPLLPALPAPLVPEALRPRFRRLLARPKNTPSLERPLIAFITARGYTAHPADWMPDEKDDWAPDLYAPWLDWVGAEVSAGAAAEGSEITVENYDQWPWRERRRALAKLRARDPKAALAVIAAKASAEPAERRARLFRILETRLSEADVEFLEGLAKDRSELARSFLARLGRDGDTSALAAELAQMLELGKTGLINRRMRINLDTLKTSAQTARRRKLFRLTSLAALARALDASEVQLVESVPNGAPDEVLAFATFAAETGSDDAVRALVRSVLAEPDAPVHLMRPLAARLTPDERRSMLPVIVKRDGDLFETALMLAGDALGETPRSAFTASAHYAFARANVEAAANGDDAARKGAMRILEAALPRVGLLIDAAGARALLAQITGWGLSSAEPRLEMLHFNAALAPAAPAPLPHTDFS